MKYLFVLAVVLAGCASPTSNNNSNVITPNGDFCRLHINGVWWNADSVVADIYRDVRGIDSSVTLSAWGGGYRIALNSGMYYPITRNTVPPQVPGYWSAYNCYDGWCRVTTPTDTVVDNEANSSSRGSIVGAPGYMIVSQFDDKVLVARITGMNFPPVTPRVTIDTGNYSVHFRLH